MRILICNWKDIRHPQAGGAEVYIHEVARRWVDWGHEVTLFTARPGDLPAEEEVDGVHVVRRGNKFGVYREARHFYQDERHVGFDLVVDVVNTRPFLSPKWVRDQPVVALIFQLAREVWFYEMPLPIAALGRFWLEPRWLRHYRTVPTITISESSREGLVAYGLADVTVVPVGLDLQVPNSLPPKELQPTVAFLGRLSPNKRPADALRAFQRARTSIPGAQMWVIGTGPMEERLRKRYESEHVRFFGRVDQEEKYELIARAHALVVTSVREGWGLVVTEAAAVGTPTIGYDVPGLRDSVSASGGLLIPPRVKALTATLRATLPMWAKGDTPAVGPNGVASWSDVAAEILEHLERARLDHRGGAQRAG